MPTSTPIVLTDVRFAKFTEVI